MANDARRPSLLDQLTEGLQAAIDAQEQRNRKPKPPPMPRVLGEDIGKRVAPIFMMLSSMYYVRRNLRRKGAPEWVAYAVGIFDLRLIQIVIRLLAHEKQLELNRKKIADTYPITISDLSLRPGESHADVLNRLREALTPFSSPG